MPTSPLIQIINSDTNHLKDKSEITCQQHTSFYCFNFKKKSMLGIPSSARLCTKDLGQQTTNWWAFLLQHLINFSLSCWLHIAVFICYDDKTLNGIYTIFVYSTFYNQNKRRFNILFHAFLWKAQITSNIK